MREQLQQSYLLFFSRAGCRARIVGQVIAYSGIQFDESSLIQLHREQRGDQRLGERGEVVYRVEAGGYSLRFHDRPTERIGGDDLPGFTDKILSSRKRSAIDLGLKIERYFTRRSLHRSPALKAKSRWLAAS